MTVTATAYAMAVRIEVDQGQSVLISDRSHITTGSAPLVHWAQRGPAADTVYVQVDGVSRRITVDAQPAAGTPLIGVHGTPYIFGSTTHRDLAGDLNRLPAGIDVVRIALAWADMQPSSASWGPEATYVDSVLADINARGMQVILSVGTSPAWARSGGTVQSPPTDPATFGQWVDDVIDRFSPIVTIRSIDPWNEPNQDSFFSGTDAQYLGLLRAAHSAAAGRVPIALGSIALADVAWIETLFGLGMTGADFDVVDFHPYPIGFTPAVHWVDPTVAPPTTDAMSSLVAGAHAIEHCLASHGVAGRDLIVSEYGLPDNPDDAAAPHLRCDDRRAGAWLATAIDQAKRIPSIKAFCIHQAADLPADDLQTSWQHGFGVLTTDRTRRTGKYDALAAAVA